MKTDEIKKRLEAATPNLMTFHSKLEHCQNDIIGSDCCDEEPFVVAQMNRNMDNWKSDLDFLVHSKTDIAYLLSAVEIMHHALEFSCVCDWNTSCPACGALQKIEELGK
jgi:hypothetical protein